MQTKLFVATKAFIVRDDKVLILKESNKYTDGANVGRFDVVGGRKEPGQNFKDSLIREVNEETGLSVVVGQPFFVNEWRPVVRGEQWQIVGVFFECQSPEGEVLLGSDHDKYEWINPLEYKEYLLIENLYPAFEAYIEFNNN